MAAREGVMVSRWFRWIVDHPDAFCVGVFLGYFSMMVLAGLLASS
jgi:hypothetical protein